MVEKCNEELNICVTNWCKGILGVVIYIITNTQIEYSLHYYTAELTLFYLRYKFGNPRPAICKENPKSCLYNYNNYDYIYANLGKLIIYLLGNITRSLIEVLNKLIFCNHNIALVNMLMLIVFAIMKY